MILRALLLLIALNMIAVNCIKGQDTFTIRVISSITEKPINEANILIRDSIYAKTNFLGYFQVLANQNDTLLITHPDYEPQYILLPNTTKFQISLKLKKELLKYSNGLGQFYMEIQKRIKYPKKAISKRMQANMFIELKIDSLGKEEVYSVHIPEHEIFMNEIERVFKELPGSWSTDYSGKVIILPILFRISSLPHLEVDTSLVPNTSILLSEVIVTAYR